MRGHREFYLLDLNYEELKEFQRELKDVIDRDFTHICVVNISSDKLVGFGIGGVLAIDMICKDVQSIKDTDMKLYSKVIEICEAKDIYHPSKPLEWN